MSNSMMAARLARLREKMAAQGLNCMVVAQPENRRYLTGVAGHDHSLLDGAGWLIVGSERALFVTDFRHYETVESVVTNAEVVQVGPPFLNGVADVIRGKEGSVCGPGSVGFEADYVTYDVYRGLARRLGRRQKLVPTTGLVEQLRVVKDEDEIAAIARAIELTDQTYEYIRSVVRPGMSERAVAWQIERYMREHGAEGLAFETIVAGGPHSAVPHHSPTDRPLGENEPILIDMGARVDGYCGDLTRTFVFGRPDEKFEEVMGIVRQALAAAEECIRAGQTGREADAVARDVIAAAGYGEAFGHSLGHGIGLEIHEAPRLSFRATEERLAPGMVVTIEPGIYLSGWGGIRVEDAAIVTADGVRVLTRATKDYVMRV